MQEVSDEPSLLVWRNWREMSRLDTFRLRFDECRYCRAPISFRPVVEDEWEVSGGSNGGGSCPLCGWAFELVPTPIEQTFDGEYNSAEERILRSFKISSGSVALSELGTHLRAHFSDIYSLEPYRFEELVGDVFKQIGYSVEMTKRSRDGGVDLFILSASGNRTGIVQCKRYAEDRHVGVTLVSELLGTQLAFDVGIAVLVTTSTFTRPARERASASGVLRHGFEVQLVDATDLLKLLRVYNDKLPRLEFISASFLKSRGLANGRI